jgi:hypothetical protein
MATHVAFLHDHPLDEVVARRKRIEFRLSFGRLACESVREGDVLLLKRVGGEVEAACDVGKVLIHTDLTPEEVSGLARGYDLGAARPYFERYTPPANANRPVNAAAIELLNVRSATLPPEVTPRGVQSAWVADFDRGGQHTGKA